MKACEAEIDTFVGNLPQKVPCGEKATIRMYYQEHETYQNIQGSREGPVVFYCDTHAGEEILKSLRSSDDISEVHVALVKQ